MQIEPNVVEPGFIKRWTVQSIYLIFRSPIIWSFIVLITFLGGSLLDFTVWYLLFGGLIFMFSMEVAAYSDHNTINYNSFVNIMFNTWNHYVDFIKQNRLYFFIFISLIFILGITAKFFFVPPVEKKDLYFELLKPIFSTVLFGYLFFNHGGKLNLFSYPLKRAFDSKENLAITATCYKASVKNPKVTRFFDLTLFMVPFFICLIFPSFGIALVVLMPCFVYVAFREIFLGQNKNNEQQKSTDTQKSKMIPIKISND